MQENPSLFYFRMIMSMLVIFTAVIFFYLALMQYVIAPNVPYTQVCSGFVRDQDLIMMLEGRFLTVRGETLFIHDIACAPH